MKEMQNVSKVGSINFELQEIKKMQKNPDALLTLWSNTCAGYYTIICC